MRERVDEREAVVWVRDAVMVGGGDWQGGDPQGRRLHLHRLLGPQTGPRTSRVLSSLALPRPRISPLPSLSLSSLLLFVLRCRRARDGGAESSSKRRLRHPWLRRPKPSLRPPSTLPSTSTLLLTPHPHPRSTLRASALHPQPPTLHAARRPLQGKGSGGGKEVKANGVTRSGSGGCRWRRRRGRWT
jgi:hypothetical protein